MINLPNRTKRIPLVCIFLLIMSVSCEKKTDPVHDILDGFSKNRYYDSEIFTEAHMGIYGKWTLYGVSGGFHGGGHELNFDYLKVNRIGIYGYFRSDSLLEYGRIRIDEQTAQTLLIFLEPDEDSEIFMYDNEKYVRFFGNDTLSLDSPCCDRYNYHFSREK